MGDPAPLSVLDFALESLGCQRRMSVLGCLGADGGHRNQTLHQLVLAVITSMLSLRCRG